MSIEPSVLAIIVAMDRSRLIGRAGGLPWRLPNDLRHFKRLTVGKTVLMGRKTWDSLGRPLPERENWVLTRDPRFAAPGCRVFHTLEAALEAHRHGELMVIGGAELYRQTLPQTERIYLTEVDAELPGDTYFPELKPSQWREVWAEPHPADAHHPYAYCFKLLERKS
ncbi:dihydrofolate reductase [Fontimonas thermophila]|uniref:Dihydrofolate reductase n=1 Tax=Fontimonas thermophila TaxID=1076937 RepID=A0A1I2I6J5_9GAMM|nr:dihydrofolate reductase [Fontimonas thermophila]SFF37922.1 dihydrofolate reductase [Fontimonas thermophila]